MTTLASTPHPSKTHNAAAEDRGILQTFPLQKKSDQIHEGEGI
jgi:hypothetical protein